MAPIRVKPAIKDTGEEKPTEPGGRHTSENNYASIPAKNPPHDAPETDSKSSRSRLSKFMKHKISVAEVAIILFFAFVVILIGAVLAFWRLNARIDHCESLNTIHYPGNTNNEDYSTVAHDLENFRDQIKNMVSSLQQHISSTNRSLTVLQHQLEGAEENTELQYTTLANSLANLSQLYSQLETDIKRNLSHVNSSLHQEIQIHSGRIRAEAHDLVNRSTAEVFEHIETEIADSRGYIRSLITEVRANTSREYMQLERESRRNLMLINSSLHQEIQLHSDRVRAEARDLVNRSTAEVFEHIETEISDSRDYILSLVEEIRANTSQEYMQLERDSRMNLTLVNSSLHQEIQLLSNRLTATRVEAHELANSSRAEAFEHIETEITAVTGLIHDQTSDIRDHVGTRVSEVSGQFNNSLSEMRTYIGERIHTEVTVVRNYVDDKEADIIEHVDSQVSEVRGYINSQDSETRSRISAAVDQARGHTDSEIRLVSNNFNTQLDRVNNDIDELKNEAIAPRTSGLIIILFVCTVILIQ